MHVVLLLVKLVSALLPASSDISSRAKVAFINREALVA